jgi:hypothetical protein
LVALGEFEGNLWAGEAKPRMGFFIDERADEGQRMALQMIFGGQAGGWPAGFAALIADMRGFEFVPITFEVAGDLAFWRAEIDVGRRSPGPTTPPASGSAIQSPGSGRPQGGSHMRCSVEIQATGFGFNQTGQNWSNKHIPFDWRAQLRYRGTGLPKPGPFPIAQFWQLKAALGACD